MPKPAPQPYSHVFDRGEHLPHRHVSAEEALIRKQKLRGSRVILYASLAGVGAIDPVAMRIYKPRSFSGRGGLRAGSQDVNTSLEVGEL